MNNTQKLTLTSMVLTGLIMTMMPFVYAEQVTVSSVSGSSVPGCEETNECYIPYTVTINLEDEVMWSNDDTAAHTVTSGTPAEGPDGIFDSGLFMAGATYPHTFDTIGEYDYFCMVHPWMIGKVFVTADAEKDSSTTMTGLQTDNLVAEITTSEGKANEEMTIKVVITDIEGNPPEHLTYSIKASQGSKVLIDEEGHMHKGVTTATHTTSALPLDASEDMPVNITASTVGFGHDDQYREVPGEIATKQVVPEFGTIAVMILAIAIISIIAVSAKSKLSIMPKI